MQGPFRAIALKRILVSEGRKRGMLPQELSAQTTAQTSSLREGNKNQSCTCHVSGQRYGTRIEKVESSVWRKAAGRSAPYRNISLQKTNIRKRIQRCEHNVAVAKSVVSPSNHRSGHNCPGNFAIPEMQDPSGWLVFFCLHLFPGFFLWVLH